MRLTAEQQTVVRDSVTEIVGATVRIYVFGSRLRDDARGGDLDLLLESDKKLSVLQRARVKLALENRLGMPVDILAMQQGAVQTTFKAMAHKQGVLL